MQLDRGLAGTVIGDQPQRGQGLMAGPGTRRSVGSQGDLSSLIGDEERDGAARAGATPAPRSYIGSPTREHGQPAGLGMESMRTPPRPERRAGLVPEARGPTTVQQQQHGRVALQQIGGTLGPRVQERSDGAPPSYDQSLRDSRWVTQKRGGQVPAGLSEDQRDLSLWMQLGAGGRPVGAATQMVDGDGGFVQARRELYTPSPMPDTCQREPSTIPSQAPPTDGHGEDGIHQRMAMVIGAIQLQLQEMERFRRDILLRQQQAEQRLQQAQQEAGQEGVQREAHLQAVAAGFAQEAVLRQEGVDRMANEDQQLRAKIDDPQASLAQEKAHKRGLEAKLANEATDRRLEF